MRPLCAGHTNVNGLFPSHFALLEHEVAESRFDAVTISETKINPLAGDLHLALDGFNFFHVDIEGMGGGGVGLYVGNSFSVNILCTSDPFTINDNSPEFLICELRKGQLRLLFAAVYHRPHATLSTSMTVSLITSPTFLPSSSPVILT